MSLEVKWIPWELNAKADAISNLADYDDYPLTNLSFKELTYFGGPTPLTDLLVPITLRYQDLTLRFFQTGCVAVDAFSQDWEHDNDWICPPVCPLIRAVRHVELCKARGTVILPLWRSSCFWTLFCRDGVQ